MQPTNQPNIDTFYDYSKTMNTSNSDEEIDMSDLSMNSNNYLNLDFTKEEINEFIDNLYNSKSPTPSVNIINEYIKTTKTSLIPIYTKFFDAILETGILPHSWLEGFIIPVFKNNGDPTDASDYQHITILSCMGKLFT